MFIIFKNYYFFEYVILSKFHSLIIHTLLIGSEIRTKHPLHTKHKNLFN